MPKYVCDYSQVRDAGNKLIEAASIMNESTNTYSSSLETGLSGWTGQAKNSFSKQSSSQIENAKTRGTELSEFGEFIVDAASKIEKLDEELTSIRI